MQVDPIKSALKAAGSKRLTLKHYELLSSFPFKFNLRHYIELEFVDHARWREADPVVREMYWFAHDRPKVGRCRLPLSNPR